MASLDELFRRPLLEGFSSFGELAGLSSVNALPSRFDAPRSEEIGYSQPEDVNQLAGISRYCKKVRDECIDECTWRTLPTSDYGMSFFRCKRDCMTRRGCASWANNEDSPHDRSRDFST
jgi:hypothetical protein